MVDFPVLPNVDGHQFQLLNEGPQRLEALVAMIDEARDTLRLAYYIFADDASSALVRDALVKAAERGVSVALLIDGFGAAASDGFLAPLKQAGGEFHRYGRKRTRRYLLRNHQKMAIADGCRAIIGGFNVEDSYFAGTGEGWRDLGLKMEGAAVGRLTVFFDALLDWTKSDKPRMRQLRRLLRRHSEQDGTVRWLMGGPTRELSPWARALNSDLERASQVDMIVGYFAPYSNILRRMRDAAKRGRTRIATSARSDNSVTVSAARNRYQHLLPEVEIYEYRAAMLHTKLYIVDDVTYIGSANCDVRSLYLNIENMLRIRDADFAAAMRGFVDSELAICEQITPERYTARATLWRRIRGRLSYFMMSALDYNVSRRLNFGLDGR